MLYAYLNHEKIEAAPNRKALCPLCNKEVFAKCGEINIWHWAHLRGDSCALGDDGDPNYEPETEWHKNWKLVFGKEYSEIILVKDNKKHIADIRTKKEVIIELQNSPIPANIISKREEFYGERMLWIINGAKFVNSFKEKQKVARGAEILIGKHVYTPQYELIDGFLIDIFSKLPQPLPSSQWYQFEWQNPKKSWQKAKRPIFIDFGGDTLIWILKNMGENTGIFTKVPKKNFIKKYEGNLELSHLVIKQTL